MKKSELFFVYFLNVLAMAFWGISFVWIKIVYKYYHPFTVLVFRLSIAALLMIIIAGRFEKNAPKIEKKDIPVLMLLAFFEPFLYFVGESLGLLYISSTVASLIVATIPVFMVFASFVFLKEKITGAGIAGLVLSISGILTLIFDKNIDLTIDLRGLLLMFMAVIAAIGFNILGASLVKKYKPVTLIKFQNIFGALYFFPFFLWTGVFTEKNIFNTPVTSELLVNLINLSVFSSTLSFLFYMTAVEKIGVNKANIFTYFIPMFTAVFAFFMLGESFDLSKLTGLILIVFGIIISQQKKLSFRALFRRGV